MRILITGASGFIGQHLTRELEEHFTIGVDRRPGMVTDAKIHTDILHDFSLCPPVGHRYMLPDVVVHLAAQVGRLFGEDDVAKTIADNCAMTAIVAKECGEHGVPLVYASTSEVYGDVGHRVAVEDAQTALRLSGYDWILAGRLPHNTYGLSKRHGEDYCRLYAPDKLTIWRISMPYGPGLPAGIGRAAIINFLYNAHHGLPITVHRNSERSWCWIGDTVRAMRLTIEKRAYGVWNIGRDDNPVTMLKVAEMALGMTRFGGRVPIEEVDAPPRQTVVKRLSTEKVRSLGWEPEVELEEGMWRTLEYVRTLPAPSTSTPSLPPFRIITASDRQSQSSWEESETLLSVSSSLA